MTARLLRTAFFTALFAYLGFWLLDVLSPGFVSFAFSVHLLGLLAAVLAMTWYRYATPTVRRTSGLLLATAIGLVGAGLVWFEGSMFGDFRILLAVGAFALPFLAQTLLSDERHSH